MGAHAKCKDMLSLCDINCVHFLFDVAQTKEAQTKVWRRQRWPPPAIALQLLYHLSKVPQLVELLGTTVLAITELTVGILTGLFINIYILLGKDL